MMNLLYNDILIEISYYLDYRTLKLLPILCKYFSIVYNATCLRQILLNKLSNNRLNVKNCTLQELYHILKCNLIYKNISVGYSYGLLISEIGSVYILGSLSTTKKCYNPIPIFGLKNIIEIAAGRSHSLALDKNGKVYAFGLSITEQLWINKKASFQENDSIYTINNLPSIISISAGEYHSLLLTADGKVYGCGHNFSKQLGIHYINSYKTYTDNYDELCPIPDLIDIVKVSAGADHSLVLNGNGRVYSFGSNNCGQLGINNKNIFLHLPALITFSDSIIDISAGYCHSLILSKTGLLYSFGSNNSGQLGLGDNIDKYKPELINVLTNVISMAAGKEYSLALLNNGYVYAFGNNNKYQLGLGYCSDNIKLPILIPKLNDITQITAGRQNSFALTSDKIIYTFGYNNWGTDT